MTRPQTGATMSRIAVALCAVLLSACTASTSGGGGATLSTTVVGDSQTVQIVGNEASHFDPKTVNATPGKIIITMLVPGGTPHDFEIEGVPGSRIGLLSRGGKHTVTVNLAPGRYSFLCTIHSGMTGTLVVAGASSSPS